MPIMNGRLNLLHGYDVVVIVIVFHNGYARVMVMMMVDVVMVKKGVLMMLPLDQGDETAKVELLMGNGVDCYCYGD